ncbi:MAG TPA: HAMP domain-containing sensor histidine kinase [Pyrinomonadaceae bacterium]|nr:HAMP domain-containing sensor histidine kinase [Pyrinomonadaceae bacterium]
MNRSWFPIFTVAALLGLLATLQYNWLGKISDGEHEILQKRLQTDTERFAEDFNREIQNAYFNFQLNADVWREKNYAAFNERFDFWRGKTNYPNLIKNFYFTQTADNSTILHYDAEKRNFVQTEWTDKLKNLREKLADEKNFEPIAEEIPALVMPVHEIEQTFNRILIRREDVPAPPIELPRKLGFLIIELNETVIKEQIFPDLVRKYFSESDRANYKITVENQKEQPQTIFQTQNETLGASDATAKLFSLSPGNLNFFINRDVLSTIDRRKSNVIIKQTLDTRNTQTISSNIEQRQTTNFKNLKDENPRVRIFEQKGLSSNGIWTLNAQHADGSLEQFITNTRRKNLAISFGILSLLAISIVLIFLSAQRVKLLARKQMNFVSAVSHEFRTPLAVIYSAGENLTDGVVNEEKQVLLYGNLIKREGKKLSAMVEQILAFAGARSGNRKYDLRQTNVEEIIEAALSECKSLIDEKDFSIEKEIAENLPNVIADKAALSQAIQNLIANSIKYGNGNKWLKITAQNGGDKIKIAVEDRGIGIAPKDLKHVFEPFFRSERVIDEQIHGNGLGLSLVKQTVEAHGGTIEVKSEIGKGSRFTIELKSKKVEK